MSLNVSRCFYLWYVNFIQKEKIQVSIFMTCGKYGNEILLPFMCNHLLLYFFRKIQKNKLKNIHISLKHTTQHFNTTSLPSADNIVHVSCVSNRFSLTQPSVLAVSILTYSAIWKSGNGRRKKLLQLNSRKKWSVPAHLIIWHLLIILTSSMEITSSFSRSRYTKLSTKYIMGWCLHN